MNRRYLAIACAACALVCLALAALAVKLGGPAPEPVRSSPAVSAAPVSAAPENTPAPYVSPIDFAALREDCPDAVGWLEAPGASVSYPIMFRADDNAYYISHDSEGRASEAGAIFLEDYNALDFTDPVTILYGHTTRSGAMFGSLQKVFSDPASFEENRSFTVYLPDAALEYRVFAAVPFGSLHILYYYNFSNARTFTSFFDDVFSIHSLSAITDASARPTPEDRVVILSTCLQGDRARRFLVMGVLRQQSNEEGPR